MFPATAYSHIFPSKSFVSDLCVALDLHNPLPIDLLTKLDDIYLSLELISTCLSFYVVCYPLFKQAKNENLMGDARLI